jgi:2'-5' RNA ligase
MYAIVSILCEEEAEWIKNLWNILEIDCGLTGIKYFPYPHFSWQGSENYDVARVEGVLQKIATEVRPFSVKTAGLGIFTKDNPVIYIPLVKDEQLLRFHSRLWEKASGLADHPHLYYSPENWIPHITLAILDVNKARLGCAIDQLGTLNLERELHIDNLTLVSQEGDQIGELKSHFEFQSTPVT